MDESTLLTLRAWESFCVIVGSSAGALTGLQFVVLTLITEAGMICGTAETLSAFASPNVVHFCAALLVSAIFSAPWHGPGPPGVAIAVAGVCGFVYSVTVLRRALRQRDYKPVLEDWVWHAVLPMLAYAAMVYAGTRLTGGLRRCAVHRRRLDAAAGVHRDPQRLGHRDVRHARARSQPQGRGAQGRLRNSTGSGEGRRPAGTSAGTAAAENSVSDRHGHGGVAASLDDRLPRLQAH